MGGAGAGMGGGGVSYILWADRIAAAATRACCSRWASVAMARYDL